MGSPVKQETSIETLKQIAARIAHKRFNFLDDPEPRIGGLMRDIIKALRERDQRAVRIIQEHQALDVCKDNCWTTIKAAIRKGDR